MATQHFLEAKSLQEILLDFCRTTGIRGFSYFTNSHCILEKVMWLVLIVLTAYQATNDCVVHISSYLANPTTTKVTLMYNQSMSFFVDPTLCVELSFKELTVDLADIQNATAVRLFLDRFDNITDIGGFLARKVVNGTAEINALLGLTAKMISNILSLEAFAADELTLEVGRWGELPMGKPLGLNVTLATIHEFYAIRATNFTDLVNTVAVYLCLRMAIELNLVVQYKVGNHDRRTSMSVCDRNRLSWMGSCPFDSEPAQLCFYLDNEFLLFKRTSDSVRVSLQPQNLYLPNTFQPEKAYNVYMDLDSNRVVSDVSSPITVAFGDQQDLFLQLLGFYRSIPSEQVRCWSGRGDNFMDCRGRCKAKAVLKHCGCWPLSWSGLTGIPPNVPKCSSVIGFNSSLIPQLSSPECLQNITSSYDPDAQCVTGCMRMCEATVFTLGLQPASTKVDEKFTAITVAINRFDYANYEEIPMNSLNGFLSRLGGSLGLWLGANFLGLYHVLFFFLRSAIEQSVAAAVGYSRKRKVKTIVNNNDNSATDLQAWGHFSNATVSTVQPGQLSVPSGIAPAQYSPRPSPRDNLDKFLAQMKLSESNTATVQLLEHMVDRLKRNNVM